MKRSPSQFSPISVPVLAALLTMLGHLGAFASTVWGQTYVFGRADFATGASPGALVAGDFNADGRLDIATATGNNTVSILIGKPDGTFQPHVDYTVGSSPSAIATGDFNGDGNLDVVVANSGDGTVSILLGNGGGTFQVAGHFGTGSAPASVATGDFNGDGKADLAVANSGSNSVSVLIGRGDGTFAATVDYPTGSGPVSVAAGDFNGDGKLDLAVANMTDGTVSILLGRGNGTFQAAVSYSTGEFTYPTCIALGDFNGDGKLDVASNVSILLGNGDGTFQAAIPFATQAGPTGGPIATGDFNHDGKLDLAITAQSVPYGPFLNQISILLGNGDGSFGAPATCSTGSLPNSVAVGDFNGDGGLDLAVSNSGSNTVSILLGDFDGTSAGEIDNPIGNHYYGFGPMAVGDFNGDGKLDLAIAYSCSSFGCFQNGSGVSVSLGNGDGTFSTGENYVLYDWGQYFPVTPSLVEVGDFNADGKLDLAVEISIFPTTWYLLLGNGDGTFQAPVSSATAPSGTLFVPFVDFSGDGKPDQASLSSDGSAISIQLGGSSQTLTGPHPVGLSFASLTAGDFTGDGIADLAAISFSGDGLTPTLQVFVSHAAIALYPDQLTFSGGTRAAAQSVTLSNPGLAPLKISSITATGDFTQTNDCSSTVVSSTACAITVRSTLTGTGTSTGSISIADNAPGSPHLLGLAASSGPAATLSTSAISIGGQVVGTASATHSVTLSNTGNAALSITGIATSPASFSQTTTCGSSLAAGASCTVTVTFTPSAAGGVTGMLSITDNASGSPQQVALSGVGQDFGIGPYTLTTTIPAGFTAAYDLAVWPEGGFNQTVSLVCSGAPQQSSCTVTPTSTTLDGRTHAVVTLRVLTSAPAVVPFVDDQPLRVSPGWLLVVAGSILLWLILLFRRLLSLEARRRTAGSLRLRLLTPAGTLLLLVLVWVGCGGGSFVMSPPATGGTPSGTYVVTVTATSGHLSHAVTVQLTVK